MNEMFAYVPRATTVSRSTGEVVYPPHFNHTPPNRNRKKIVGETTTVVLRNGHDPKKYYQTKAGLWVSDMLEVKDGVKTKDRFQQILARAKATPKGQTYSVAYLDLKDRRIRALRQERFNETQACAIMSRFIDKQASGEEGTLKTGEKESNLFATSYDVIEVFWGIHLLRWHIIAHAPDEYEWKPGDRTFYPAPPETVQN